MKKFELTKDTFHGKIAVVYDSAGSIFSISFEDAEIADELKESYKKYLPVRLENMERFIAAAGCTVLEVSTVIPFEKWYDYYNLKRNKEEARRIYSKIKPEEHMRIWVGTKKYLRYCSRNASWYNQMYPDTFLRKSHYNDEWDKI